MDLILWRHAEADDGLPDTARALTAKGRNQATQMAHWLRERLPEDTRILVSPATRAQQTAQALTTRCENNAELAPGAAYTGVLAASGWPDADATVLVVGHQPALGQLAALLLAGAPQPWNLKKGAIWWLSHRLREGREQVVLRAALSPDLL
jgi:phosphohistidine phosphatase